MTMERLRTYGEVLHRTVVEGEVRIDDLDEKV